MSDTVSAEPSADTDLSGAAPAKRAGASRRRILDVSARLFRARGYAETSLRDIGASAGMKGASLYYHFASKEELAAEVLRIGVRRVHRAVAAAIEAPGVRSDPKAKLGAAMDAHLATLLDASDYTSAHIRCFPFVPESLRRQLSDERGAYESVWRLLLAEAAASGALAPGVAPDAARVFILGALNWSLEWYDPNRGPPSGLTKSLLAAFTR